ncbi:hypothetical protein MFIFM68171_08053 [Madurella fahalii]|uniref:Uncharacterized protein n=1 Tax=Madurella fahalii TaxID=1157608 RepID=A0ABQ0GJ92_9PEZI
MFVPARVLKDAASPNMEATSESTSGKSFVSRTENTANATTLGSIAGWPTTPRKIQTKSWIWATTLAGDVILALLPVAFFALAGLAVCLEGRQISEFGESIVEATRLGPSIYPIIFAAVASRFYRTLALWRATGPKGITIGALEQILGSQSLAGTLHRIVSVRSHTLIGLPILLTWALSPIGGQSSSRLLYATEEVTDSVTTAYYSSTDTLSVFHSANMASKDFVTVSTLYSASLSASRAQKQAGADLWLRPKIPRLRTTNQIDGAWQEVNQTGMSDDDYASLIGIKVQGLEELSVGKSYNFLAEVSYIDFGCSLFRSDISREDTLSLLPNSSYIPDVARSFSFIGGSLPQQDRFTVQSSFFVTSDLPRWNRTLPTNYLHIYYGSRNTDRSQRYTLFSCTAKHVALEMAISCVHPVGCGVTRIRRSLSRRNEPDNRPPWTIASPAIANALMDFPLAARNGDAYTFSPTDNFIMGEEFPLRYRQLRDWTGVSDEQFSRRLTTAFNTFYLASLDPNNGTDTDVTQRPSSSSSSSSSASASASADAEHPPIGDAASAVGADEPRLISTPATLVTTQRVYRISRPWTGVFVAATVVLQVFALLGLCLPRLAASPAPEIFDFASSLTRENPWVPLPPGGSAMSGAERARVLRNMRVRVGDVMPRKEIGYVGVAAVGEGHQVEVEGLSWKRWYW